MNAIFILVIKVYLTSPLGAGIQKYHGASQFQTWGGRVCRLEGSGSSEEGPSRQRKNPGQIVFVYLYRWQIDIPRGGIICTKKPNKTILHNGSGHFLVFICESVQKKRLFGLSQQNRYEKEQSRTKKASQRDLCVCVSEYPPNKNTALDLSFK